MGRELHNAAGNAGLFRQRLRQLAVNLEAQHVGGSGFEQFRCLRQRHNLALFKHRNSATQRLGFFQIVRGEQHSTALLVEFGDELPQRLAQFDIDTGRRFVKHNDFGFVNQGLRHQNAALHPPRQLTHVGIGLVRQAKTGQQLVNPVIIAFNAEVAGLNAQGFANAEKRVKHQLLRHHTQCAAGGSVVGQNIVAVHCHVATAGPRQTRQNADKRGFTCAIGPEQAEEFALMDVKAHVVQCFDGWT